MAHDYSVHILTNSRQTVLCTDVTNNLVRRVSQHRQKLAGGFTTRYNVDKPVFFEQTTDIARRLRARRRSREDPGAQDRAD